MGTHHLLKELDILDICPYCNNALAVKNWELDKVHNYLHTNCNCGMDIQIKIDSNNALHIGLLEKTVLDCKDKEKIFELNIM